MKLNNFTKIFKDDKLLISINVESKNYIDNKLWFEVESKYENYVCDLYDSFLVGMLYPAMINGEDIYIDGCVSERLLFNINNYVIPLLQSFSSETKKIIVNAKDVSCLNFSGKGVGTGFSGGVDSFCTIYDHYENEKFKNYKIDSLLFLNVGSHGSYENKNTEKKFLSRYEYLKSFPKEVGLDFIKVNSNLHSFHPWGHQRTCGLTAISGVMLFQNFFSKYYLSSSGFDYKHLIEKASSYRNFDISFYSDPILLPLLSTESLEFISDGNQYNRIEKTKHILNYKPVYKYLNVCVGNTENYRNCSVCNKCKRTLMTIASLGQLNMFKDVFNIESYKAIEKKYLYSQVSQKNTDLYAMANVELAKQMDYSLPNFVLSKIRYFPIACKIFLSKRLSKKNKTILKKIIYNN